VYTVLCVLVREYTELCIRIWTQIGVSARGYMSTHCGTAIKEGASMRAPRRLSCISRHVVAATPPLPEPRARAQCLLESRPAKLLSDTEVQEFIRSGWMSIGPEAIGLPSSHVRQIYEDGCAWHDGPRKPGIHAHDNLLSERPGLQEVCRSPAVHGALQSLLGHGYMLHPHGGFHPKPAGSRGTLSTEQVSLFSHACDSQSQR
jgi:hypothetical protein